MKKIICAFSAFTAATAFAQATDIAASTKHGGDMVQLVSMGQMPIPAPKSELAKAQSASVAKADDGFSSAEKSPEMVRAFFHNVNIAKTQAANPEPQSMKLSGGGLQAPVVFKDLKRLKLRFSAASVGKGELIAAAPSGTVIDGAWTGVERFFRIDGAGYMRLAETDLKATGGMFYMIKEAVNTTVAGKPAISKIFTDDDGRKVEEIVWVNGHKLYMLTFGPDMAKGRFGNAKANSHIGANSLAEGLRDSK